MRHSGSERQDVDAGVATRIIAARQQGVSRITPPYRYNGTPDHGPAPFAVGRGRTVWLHVSVCVMTFRHAQAVTAHVRPITPLRVLRCHKRKDVSEASVIAAAFVSASRPLGARRAVCRRRCSAGHRVRRCDAGGADAVARRVLPPGGIGALRLSCASASIRIHSRSHRVRASRRQVASFAFDGPLTVVGSGRWSAPGVGPTGARRIAPGLARAPCQGTCHAQCEHPAGWCRRLALPFSAGRVMVPRVGEGTNHGS